jgi:pantothenate synthetase
MAIFQPGGEAMQMVCKIKDMQQMSDRLRGRVNGVLIQYVEIRDAEMLVRIENVSKPAVIAIAAIVGSTRLIDNIIIGR